MNTWQAMVIWEWGGGVGGGGRAFKKKKFYIYTPHYIFQKPAFAYTCLLKKKSVTIPLGFTLADKNYQNLMNRYFLLW